MKFKTINFIKSHNHWKDLLQAAPYCLKIVEDNNYYMLRYNQIESDFSQKICNECRGLVIDKHTLEPVALSFPRFYNYGQEMAAEINWKSARVQEKIDGSKMLMFFDKYAKDWRLCTSGTLDAFETEVGGLHISFGKLFEAGLKDIDGNVFDMEILKKYLNKTKIYTFELASPFNRIVVPYTETQVYLIGQRDTITFEEEEPNISGLDIPRPSFYTYNSLEECITATDKMDYTEEGFVVVDKFWNRIKVKSKAYLEAHYCCNNHIITPKRVLDIIMQGEKEEFLSYFSEYTAQFKEVEQSIEKWHNDSMNAIKETMLHKFENRKELALYCFEHYKDKSSLILDFLDSIDRYLDLYLRRMTSAEKQKYLGV